MTDTATLIRIRNRIIEYLELAASHEEQTAYQTAAPHIHVPNEVINRWEDWVRPDWQRYMTAPVFSLAEIEAIAAFHSSWDAVASATPDPLPSLGALTGTEQWQRLAKAATSALEVFQIRGYLPENPDGDR